MSYADSPLNPLAARFDDEAVFSRGECGPDIRIRDDKGTVRSIRPQQIRFGVPLSGGEPTWLMIADDSDDEDSYEQIEFVLNKITQVS